MYATKSQNYSETNLLYVDQHNVVDLCDIPCKLYKRPIPDHDQLYVDSSLSPVGADTETSLLAIVVVSHQVISC